MTPTQKKKNQEATTDPKEMKKPQSAALLHLQNDSSSSQLPKITETPFPNQHRSNKLIWNWKQLTQLLLKEKNTRNWIE